MSAGALLHVLQPLAYFKAAVAAADQPRKLAAGGLRQYFEFGNALRTPPKIIDAAATKQCLADCAWKTRPCTSRTCASRTTHRHVAARP